MTNLIIDRVQQHLEETLANSKNIYDWFVIAANGSMNYNVNTEKSDVDTKLLVIPSLDQIITEDKGSNINYIHHMEDNGEHCEVKDFRTYLRTCLKQNINFLETLFSAYTIVNPLYEQFWNELISHRETIAHYSELRAVSCAFGMAKQKELSIKYYDTDNKKFATIIRLYAFIIDYLSGKSYSDCISNSSRLDAIKEVLDDKSDLTFKYKIEYIDKIRKEAKKAEEKYIYKESKESQKDIEDLFRTIFINVVKKANSIG